MKKLKSVIIAAAVIGVIGMIVWGGGKATAEYPEVGEAVSYAVNDVDDIKLEIEEPTWSPFQGYSIKWKVRTDSKNTYSFNTDGPGFEFLEYFEDGQWYRLAHTQDNFPGDPVVITVGNGDGLGLEASLIQKDHFYGTRLEPGLYRVTLKTTKNNADVHYLAQEFQIQ